MLWYIHFGERTVMAAKGEYTKHPLTFLFGLILSHKVRFLFTGLQFSVPETRCTNPSGVAYTLMEC